MNLHLCDMQKFQWYVYSSYICSHLLISVLGSVGEGTCFLMYKLLQLKSYMYLAKNDQQSTVIQCMIASGTAKLITVPVFYPAEVVRTQLQKDNANR